MCGGDIQRMRNTPCGLMADKAAVTKAGIRGNALEQVVVKGAMVDFVKAW